MNNSKKTFEKIIGYEREKKELSQLSDMLLNASYYRENGIKITHGLIIYGAFGVGKTEMAKSIAKEGISLVELSATDCYMKDAKHELKNAFSAAKARQPAVILLDDFDRINEESDEYCFDENSNVIKTLIQEFDSISPQDDILVVATCINNKVFGEAILTPGRFDRSIFVDIPDFETRKQIFEEYFGCIKLQKDLNYDYLANITSGYTGSEIEHLTNEVGIYALAENKNVILTYDVQTVMNRIVFEGSEKSLFEDKETLKALAAHEAGHAVVALVLSPDCIYGASVLQQGSSNGHIYYVNKNFRTRPVFEIEDEITMLLAGHVAERLCGKLITGSSSDLSKARGIMENLVIQEGIYGYEGVLCDTLSYEHKVSPSMQNEASSIMLDLFNELDEFAESIIKENQTLFVEITKRLVKNKVLSRAELLELKEQFSPMERRHTTKDSLSEFSRLPKKLLVRIKKKSV